MAVVRITSTVASTAASRASVVAATAPVEAIPGVRGIRAAERLLDDGDARGQLVQVYAVAAV